MVSMVGWVTRIEVVYCDVIITWFHRSKNQCNEEKSVHNISTTAGYITHRAPVL